MSVEALIKHMSSLSDEQLAQIPEEDRQQAASLIQQYQSSSKNVESPELPEEEMSSLEAAGYGAANNFFIKDAIAMGEAIYQDATDDDGLSVDTIANNYETNRKEIEANISRAKEEHPWAYGAGDIGANIAGTIATGGALKAAGVAAGATATVLGGVLGQGLTNVSQESYGNRDVGDFKQGLVQGVMGEAIAGGAGVLLKSAAKYAKSSSDDLYNSVVRNFFKVDKAAADKVVKKHLAITGQSSDEFVERVFSETLDDGVKVLDLTDDVSKNLERVKIRKSQLNATLDNVYKTADDILGKPSIDLASFKEQIKINVIDPLLKNGDPATRDAGVEMLDYLNRAGNSIKRTTSKTVNGVEEIIKEIEPDKTWTITQINDLQKSMMKSAENAFKNQKSSSTAAEQIRRIGAGVREVKNNAIGSLNIKDQKLLDVLKETNKSYGNMATVDTLLEKQAKAMGKHGFWEALQGAIKPKNMWLSGIGATVGGIAAGPGGALAGAGVGKTLQMLIDSPSTPMYAQKYLAGLAKALSNEPASKASVRIIAAAAKGSEELQKVVNGEMAKRNLGLSPIQRNTADSITKTEHIKYFLEDVAPELSRQYEDIIENGDEEQLAAFLDQASKLPGANKYFQPGLGFNGKVYTEEDKAQLIVQLNQGNLPASQRVKLVKQIRDSGIIPDLNTQVQPQQQKVYTPRNKRQLQF